jgi:hypothetical protein
MTVLLNKRPAKGEPSDLSPTRMPLKNGPPASKITVGSKNENHPTHSIGLFWLVRSLRQTGHRFPDQ